MTQFPDHPFWDYSLDVYMQDKVGAACIDLQERYQLDVNVLLFCLWFGASDRGRLGKEDLQLLLDISFDWHHAVVRKLREIRMIMKGGISPVPDTLCESLRQRIQKIEIDCEHAEQLVLAGAVTSAGGPDRSATDRASDAAANMGAYLKTFSPQLSDTDRSQIGILLSAGISGLSADVGNLCATL